jgi:sulfite reductase (NADPH) hemoprotein beta-component
MYRYDDIDKAFVRARVAEFRDQAGRRLSGALTEDQFKPLRLYNGLYLQLHAYMLRVAIPYGTLSTAQLRGLGDVARKFDRGYVHFTTRQNVQYNWVKLKDAADALEVLADVDMHAMQTSGSVIRNVTTDVYAGATPDETEDPRIVSEAIRQWSTLHPEFNFLPRKFKIAVTATPEDRAAMRVHDMGIELAPDGIAIWAGGGQGRTAALAIEVKRGLTRANVFGWMEAVMRTYNRFARRDNLYKSRIKILVASLGADAFRKEVEEEYAAGGHDIADLKPEAWALIEAAFAPIVLAEKPGRSEAFEALHRSDPAFAAFAARMAKPHKVAGYVNIDISLKRPDVPPGDATAEELDLIADLADRYGAGEVRVSHVQNLVITHVARDNLPKLWEELREAGLAEANVGLSTDVISCPGLDYCSLANARSIPVAQGIANTLRANGLDLLAGDLRINVSGCINACAHHHVAAIGVLGVDKRGEEFYQILLGGSSGTDAALGEITGKGVPAADVVGAVVRVVQHYVDVREDGETFLQTLKRLGRDTFKEAIYGASDHAHAA